MKESAYGGNPEKAGWPRAQPCGRCQCQATCPGLYLHIARQTGRHRHGVFYEARTLRGPHCCAPLWASSCVHTHLPSVLATPRSLCCHSLSAKGAQVASPRGSCLARCEQQHATVTPSAGAHILLLSTRAHLQSTWTRVCVCASVSLLLCYWKAASHPPPPHCLG